MIYIEEAQSGDGSVNKREQKLNRRSIEGKEKKRKREREREVESK